MTSLEALDNLRCMLSLSQDCNYKESNDLCDTIEKELKRLEEIDEVLNTGGGICAETGIVSKKLKALEAIKRNPILIIRLLTNNASYKYVVEVTNESERPTEEEWNLLNEVL